MAWFKEWFNLTSKPKLPGLLKDYPPYSAPYPGSGDNLTPKQAQANLNYLLTHKRVRINIFAELLEHFDIDIHTGLKAADPKVLLDQLHRWVHTQWPSVHTKSLATLPYNHWVVSTRNGDEIVFSMLMDMAIVLGELVLRHQPEFYWDINRNPQDKGMTSHMRPVIMRKTPGVKYPSCGIEMADFEVSMWSKYCGVISPGANTGLSFRETAIERINRPRLKISSDAHR